MFISPESKSYRGYGSWRVAACRRHVPTEKISDLRGENESEGVSHVERTSGDG